MLRLGGEVADGTFLNFLPLVGRRARRRRRSRRRDGHDVVCRFFCIPQPPEEGLALGALPVRRLRDRAGLRGVLPRARLGRRRSTRWSPRGAPATARARPRWRRRSCCARSSCSARPEEMRERLARVRRRRHHDALPDAAVRRRSDLPALIDALAAGMSDDLVTGDDGRARCRWGASTPDYARLPRRGVGPPGPRRRRAVRAALPRGVPVRPLVADDPAQARGVPRGVRRLRDRRGRALRRRRRRAADGRRGDRPQPGEDRGGDRQRPRRRARSTTSSALIWSFAPDPAPGPAPRSIADVPAVTPESTALAKELKRRGFRFVGPTTAYALMQACGLVNDHLEGCWAR